MNIVVCVKQVPDTANLKFDSQGNIQTDGLENMMNPCCGYAVENAIRIKEASDGNKVTVFTIGPAQSKEVLKRALAMGADEAYHLSDAVFMGGDSIAAGYTLAEAIKKYVPDFNLIFCGQFTDDEMAGVTGPAIAEYLNIPSLTICNKVEVKDASTVTVHRESSQGMEVHEMTLPGLVCFANSEVEPRIPSIKGVMKANRTEIPSVELAALGVPAEKVGIQGSPSKVMEKWRKPRKEGGRQVEGSDPQEAVSQLIAFLKEQKVM